MVLESRALTDIDRTIHEPARLLIMTALLPLQEADFTYLLQDTGLTKGNLSSHLSRLEKAGYVEIEKTYQGKLPLTLCRMTPQGRSAFEQYRQTIRALMAELPPSAS